MSGGVERIEISRAVPFLGTGDSLENRLRAVTLRGFPQVAIYKNAHIGHQTWAPDRIRRRLSTPQPHVHRTHLDRVSRLATHFARHGINLYALDAAYDYTAYDENGTATEWTMLPPVVEHFNVPRHPAGGFDYSAQIGPELKARMEEYGWPLNPAAESLNFNPPAEAEDYYLINDGSHRVHAGLERGEAISLIVISGSTPGYPYYAVPQPYSRVQVFPTEAESKDLKVHVLVAPGHKQLYRNFPSGGILSGDVRPARPGEEII